MLRNHNENFASNGYNLKNFEIIKKLVSFFSILLLISCDKESEGKLESIIGKWELVGY
mgnify:CR=1 FL=1